LNPTKAQQQAINSDSPNILMIAGAGSGKTATLIARIQRLVSEGVSPSSILCLTFTRKAANELKERLTKLIGASATKKIWAGTFHSISYRILSQWGSKIGYQTDSGKSITVITPEESEDLLKEIIKAYKYDGTLKSISEARSVLAHDGTEPEDLNIKRIIGEYHARLKECNAVDFDLLLLEVQKLFKACPAALEFYQTKFDHIFVDEYQDTDQVQYNLHEILKPKHLFCVGDSDQAIYGWRGANIGIILAFEEAHAGAEVIKLEECFRCADVIVGRANALIDHNENRIEKTLIGATGNEGVFEVALDSSPEFVAEYLSEYLAFEDPKEIAVIARTHRALEAIERACVEKCLNVLRVGKATAEIEATESFKFMRAYLRLAMNPRDNIAFLTANKIGFRQNLKDIWQHANNHGCSWYEAYGDTDPITSEQDLIEFYEQTCAYLEMEPEERVIEYLQTNWPGITADDWLAEYSLKDSQLELEKKNFDKITLLTAHAAKGLEWDNVLIADFEEEKFPSKTAIRSGNLEEERRLAYVSFTRARKRLILFSTHGKYSRFISEAYNLDSQSIAQAA